VPFVKRHRIIAILAALVLVTLTVLATTAVAVWRAAHNDEARRVDHVDLIAVLGAAQYNGTPSPVFQGRLEQGELLFQKGFASKLLVLGGKEPGDRTTEGEAGRDWLVAHGLPAADVFADPVGNDTLQSIHAAAAFMSQHALRSVFLVSDPWHNLRIRRMARDMGLDAFVSATWHSAATSQWLRLQGYVRETFAYLEYRTLHR
jgi:vancomycin permeability regulator SanA